MIPNAPHVFAAVIEQMRSAVVTHIIPVPPEIAEEYIESGKRRVIVTVAGEDIRRYLFQTANGVHAVIMGKSRIRDLRLPLHEPIIVEVRPDPDPDAVDVPDEFVAVLEEDQAAARRFYAMSKGKQRGFALHVASAKRSETRIKRALDVAYKLRTYTLYGDKHPPAK